MIKIVKCLINNNKCELYDGYYEKTKYYTFYYPINNINDPLCLSSSIKKLNNDIGVKCIKYYYKRLKYYFLFLKKKYNDNNIKIIIKICNNIKICIENIEKYSKILKSSVNIEKLMEHNKSLYLNALLLCNNY